MKKIFIILVVVFGLISFVTSGCGHSSDETKSKQAAEKVLYQCPMDCESGKTYDKPGKCTVCEMDLDKVAN